MFRFKVLEINLKRWIEKYKSMGPDKFYQILIQYAVSRIAEEEEIRKAEAEKKISSSNMTVQKQASSISGSKSVSFSSKKTFKVETTKVSPEAELLAYCNHFTQLYRKERVELYRDIAFSFKRAANKAYRLMVSKNMINKSSKFLNVVG